MIQNLSKGTYRLVFPLFSNSQGTRSAQLHIFVRPLFPISAIIILRVIAILFRVFLFIIKILLCIEDIIRIYEICLKRDRDGDSRNHWHFSVPASCLRPPYDKLGAVLEWPANMCVAAIWKRLGAELQCFWAQIKLWGIQVTPEHFCPLGSNREWEFEIDVHAGTLLVAKCQNHIVIFMHITVQLQIVDMLQSALNDNRRDIIHNIIRNYAVAVTLVQASLLIAAMLTSQGSEIWFNKYQTSSPLILVEVPKNLDLNSSKLGLG